MRIELGLSLNFARNEKVKSAYHPLRTHTLCARGVVYLLVRRNVRKGT